MPTITLVKIKISLSLRVVARPFLTPYIIKIIKGPTINKGGVLIR